MIFLEKWSLMNEIKVVISMTQIIKIVCKYTYFIYIQSINSSL